MSYLQKKQQEEFTEQKHLAERQNKNKLNTFYQIRMNKFIEAMNQYFLEVDLN